MACAYWNRLQQDHFCIKGMHVVLVRPCLVGCLSLTLSKLLQSLWHYLCNCFAVCSVYVLRHVILTPEVPAFHPLPSFS